MSDKKSVIEEALAEFSLIQENLNSNTKEILRSVAKEEITSALNESLSEDDYDIEDIDVDGGMDTDVDALPVDDAPEMTPDMGGMDGGSEELGIDDIGMDTADGDLDGLEAGEGGEDYGMDMTAASDEEVISVYKKLSGEDEIEVVSSDEVIIKDPVSGSEYNVKMNGGSLVDGDELAVDDLGAEMDLDVDAEIEPEMNAEPEMDIEEPVEEPTEEPEMDDDGGDTYDAGEESEEEEEEDMAEESVVYEIELSEDEAIEEGLENDPKINKDSKIGNTADGKPRTATSDRTMGKEASAPNSGDIEGQTADADSEIKGDNLEGGFTEKTSGKDGNHASHVMESEDEVNESGNIDGQTAPEAKPAEEKTHASGDAHADHVMKEGDEEVNENEEVNETDEVVEGLEDVTEGEDSIEETEEVTEEDAIDEHIPKGQSEARRAPARADIGQPVAPGAKQGVKAVRGESVQGKKLTEAVTKYNTLLAEAKELKKENDLFRNSLKDFRKSITETAVFNTNLTHVTKLFVEHSTTSEEKQNILTRFDEEVSTIEESKKLYKAISSELGKKTPISESIENKLVADGKASSQSSQLNETTAYVDPLQTRVLDLFKRTQR